MQFSEFQRLTHETARYPSRDSAGFLIHGIAGEVGTLASEYKKLLRDGGSHDAFRRRATEELGDMLWYVSSLATELSIDLDRIAIDNIEKCTDRWGETASGPIHFDDDAPPSQQLPRRFAAQFVAGGRVVELLVDGAPAGDELNDNSWHEDGYRFHDAFHISYAAVLGWSPVLRSLLRCKRKFDSGPGGKDEAEDGARAIATEEAVSAFVFRFAERSGWFQNVKHLDSDLLQAVKLVVGRLEVSARSAAEWEVAILQGFEMWRALRAHDGGTIHADLNTGSVLFEPPHTGSNRTTVAIRD